MAPKAATKLAAKAAPPAEPEPQVCVFDDRGPAVCGTLVIT